MLATGIAAAAERKSQLDQFFTSPAIAGSMAGLFAAGREAACRLLDAGTGIGSLSDAILRRWRAGGVACQGVQVDAFEIDE